MAQRKLGRGDFYLGLSHECAVYIYIYSLINVWRENDVADEETVPLSANILHCLHPHLGLLLSHPEVRRKILEHL